MIGKASNFFEEISALRNCGATVVLLSKLVRNYSHQYALHLFLRLLLPTEQHPNYPQTDQTEPLDLSKSKVREKGNGSQGLSVERENEEEIGLQ
ncbi:unnamed protein product, partial [Wuchereria bancrofti]